VIVDAPPILPVTDAALIAAHTSGAILVVRHGRTTRDQAAQARQRLDSVGAQVLGTVFNFVPQRAISSYGYGYGYGYAPTTPVQAELNQTDHIEQVAGGTSETTVPTGDTEPVAEPAHAHRNGNASGALHRATS